ncbi:Nitroreductase-like protein [Talaromyces proteolyticus]|uniref:Nitroreductase-like protein n=1 Tax=Talaromyces proteolyticus TaxID=1131652 RepID=A0AAD4KE12_9EURO|nr:Nitroreductase-like protein [Talaromyces proteolyticus]KAH8689418.1 Nitroreductase-like protein [Talaromyces proteolyticus]
MSFAIATQKRRSIRALQPISPVPDRNIIDLASNALLYVPSAFNSQTTRLTIHFSEAHRKLWSITGAALETNLGSERYKSSGSADKINAYSKGYGTILFWDDIEVLEQMKKGAADHYKDKAEEWVHQSNGMHQYYLWVALEEHGLGVNVQHYNPLIDEGVRKEWGISGSWKLRAQMVFGLPEKGTLVGEKEQKVAIEERLKVFHIDGEEEGKL